MHTIESLKSRIALLEARTSDNGRIITKLKRKLRKLESKQA
jgi:hypothetical protein